MKMNGPTREILRDRRVIDTGSSLERGMLNSMGQNRERDETETVTGNTCASFAYTWNVPLIMIGTLLS
jgi:hypothetical protein